MNAIRVDKREFTINGDTVIHTPTGAKFFARPGHPDLVNWDLGLAHPGRLMREYDEHELCAVAAQVLEERFTVQPVPVPMWTLVHDIRAGATVHPYFAGVTLIALLACIGAIFRGF